MKNVNDVIMLSLLITYFTPFPRVSIVDFKQVNIWRQDFKKELVVRILLQVKGGSLKRIPSKYLLVKSQQKPTKETLEKGVEHD